jgi:UDP-galactopyranose mutase
MKIKVIGAGLFGISFAKIMAEKGHRVVLIEANDEIGGHIADQEINGVLVSKHGPHIFHTNDHEVWEFANRFATFKPYEHKVKTFTEKGWMPWPINADSIKIGFDYPVKGPLSRFDKEVEEAKQSNVDTFDMAIKRSIGETMFDLTVRSYSEKQWGVPAEEIPAETAGRVRVKRDRNERFFADDFVALPKEGYTQWLKEMVKHINIDMVRRMSEAMRSSIRKETAFDLVVNTAPPDKFLNYEYGKLKYRSIKFVESDKPSNFPTPVVNFAVDWLPFTRATDYGMLRGGDSSHVIFEIPSDDGIPMYPVRTRENLELAHKYNEDLRLLGVISAGRLGAFEYNDMDTTIRKAMNLATKVCE